MKDLKHIQEKHDSFKWCLQEIVYLLKEQYEEILREHLPEDIEAIGFQSGTAVTYYGILRLLRYQGQSFFLPLREVGLKEEIDLPFRTTDPNSQSRETKKTWHTLSLEEQKALLEKRWPDEIKRLREQLNIVKETLNGRNLKSKRMRSLKYLVRKCATFKYYFWDLVYLLKEKYKEAIEEQYEKTDYNTGDLKEKGFLEGTSITYYGVLSLLRYQAKSFLLPLKEIGLEEPIDLLLPPKKLGHQTKK